ncbi:MAG: PAS domain-containing sensor histidine kinase [Pseudobdellovibrionaceae bacterium]
MFLNSIDEFKQGLKQFLKVLIIIGVWETLIMAVLPFLNLNPVIGGLVDVLSLTFLCGLSLWLFVYLPESKRIRKKLDASNEAFNRLLNVLGQSALVSVTDERGKIIYASNAFCEISGYSREELIGKDHRIINSGCHPKDFFKRMWTQILAGNSWQGRVCNRNKNGNMYWVQSTILPLFDEGKITKFLSIRFDVTAEKYALDAIEQEKVNHLNMARLASLGEMASGIAHEINNPLGIIDVSLSILEKCVVPNSPQPMNYELIRDKIAKSRAQITRIVKIISVLRNIAGDKKNSIYEVVPFSKVAETVENLYSEKLRKKNIELKVLDKNCEIKCNYGQLEQVMINLIDNAVDGVENLPEKWIKIAANQKGDYIEVSVTDSGTGITDEISKKFFQPFFTTKETGKGMGIGLNIVKAIVDQHSGYFFLDEKSPNTKFVVGLPLHDKAVIDLSDINDVISSHVAWRQDFIFSLSAVLDHENNAEQMSLCKNIELEKWIKKVEPLFVDEKNFQDLKEAYNKCHLSALDIVNRCKSSFVLNEAMVGSNSEFDNFSNKVIYHLKQLQLDRLSNKIG